MIAIEIILLIIISLISYYYFKIYSIIFRIINNYVMMTIVIFRLYLKPSSCFNNKLLVNICGGVQDALNFDIYCISDHFETDTIAV